MRLIFKLLFSFIYILSFSSCIDDEVSDVIVIKGVTIFDGEIVFRNSNLIFCKDSIISISSENAYPKNAIVIEGYGKTVIPPMINAHVHVMDSINLFDAQRDGIFGMLDMFTTDSRANYFKGFNNRLYSSYYYSSNVGATVPGGHGTQFGINIPTINNLISPKQFVTDRLVAGADYIKITQESSMNVMSDSLLELVILEAKNSNLISIAHISDVRNAVKLAGFNINGLAHIWYRKGSIIDSIEIQELKSRSVFVIPTLSVIEEVIKSQIEEINYLKFSEVQSEVEKLLENDISILVGTDSPNFNLNYTTDYFNELELLHSCGLSNIEVLRSATSNIYKAFNLNEFTFLKSGGKSSFILLSGDPIERIEEIRNEKRIWKNGIEL